MPITKQTYRQGSGYNGADLDLMNYLKDRGVDMTGGQRYSGDPTTQYYEVDKQGNFLGGSDREAWMAQQRAGSTPTAGFNLGNLGGAFGGLGGALGGGGGTGGGTGASSGGGAPNPAELDAQGSARAREQIGGNMRGAVKALQELYAGRGMMGSSAEGQAIGSAIGSGAEGLNEFNTNQAINNANMRYTGGITQRGQDMGLLQALLALLGQSGSSTSTTTGSGSSSYY